MATMTNEQIEQKKQLLAEKVKEMKAIYDELVEAGAWPLSDDDLDKAAGGWHDSRLRMSDPASLGYHKPQVPDQPQVNPFDGVEEVLKKHGLL